MLIDEPWFTLALQPTHIARSYQTYVRSILLFGSELLRHDERKPLYYIDAKLINTMQGKLLNLVRGLLGATDTVGGHNWH